MKKILSLILVLAMIMTVAIGCTEENNGAKFEDGVYTAEGEPDERGWKSIITITVEDGEIKEVDYDEINDDGLYKSEDEEYEEAMKSASGVSPEEAYEQLEDALESTQDVDEVDAVAGATGSSEMFKELAKEALEIE